MQEIAIPSVDGSFKIAKTIGEFEFKSGSSGPFGEDIKGGWKSANGIFKDLSKTGIGWLDVHARKKKSRIVG